MQEKKNIDNFLIKLQKMNFEIKNNIEILKELNNIIKSNWNECDTSKEYYSNKYPKFSNDVHAFLSKCSINKTHDYRDEFKLKITKGKFIIRYN